MILMIDYQKNLIVQSIKCLFLDKLDKMNECELFFSRFQLVGNVEPFPFKIGSVTKASKPLGTEPGQESVVSEHTEDVLSI